MNGMPRIEECSSFVLQNMISRAFCLHLKAIKVIKF